MCVYCDSYGKGLPSNQSIYLHLSFITYIHPEGAEPSSTGRESARVQSRNCRRPWCCTKWDTVPDWPHAQTTTTTSPLSLAHLDKETSNCFHRHSNSVANITRMAIAHIACTQQQHLHHACTHLSDRTPDGVAKMSALFRHLLSLNVQSLRIIGSSALAVVWVACGRADVFAIGVREEGAKPWDYTAAYVIATEAGAVFRRVDNRSYPGLGPAASCSGECDGEDNEVIAPFDVYSKSCVCAGTDELADTLGEIMRQAQQEGA